MYFCPKNKNTYGCITFNKRWSCFWFGFVQVLPASRGLPPGRCMYVLLHTHTHKRQVVCCCQLTWCVKKIYIFFVKGCDRVVMGCGTPPPNHKRGSRGNDPSAGSPTETLLRLHLPLNGKVKTTFHGRCPTRGQTTTIRRFHRTIQSVGATGGVYKGQGRNQCKLMTCVY